MENEWLKLFEMAKEAATNGNLEYAESLLSNALLEAEDFGRTDQRFIRTLEGLTEVCMRQSKFRRAEKSGRQVLEIIGEISGTEHLSYANAACRLAEIFHMQQKFGQAEPLYKAALAVKTKQLGSNANEVVHILREYAALLAQTHREAEAENLLECARRAEGASASGSKSSDNNSTVVSNFPPKVNLAKSGIDAAAEAGWQVRTRFDDVPENKTSAVPECSFEELEQSAEEAYKSGQYQKALAFWNQAVTLSENFPAKDPRLARSLDRLGLILSTLERFGQAEMVWSRALQLKISLYGSNHPTVAATGSQLAGLHYLLGRYAEAEAYARKCLSVYKIAHGTNHPLVALCHLNLASLYHVQGRYIDAEQHYLDCIAIRKRVLGKQHAETASAEKGLADLLKTLGRNQEAEQVYSNSNGLVTGSWKTLQVAATQTLGPTAAGKCLHCGEVLKEGRCPSCLK